ncbi:MAG: hypothetical protein IEMM0003_0604 [bacterium]|nr:MAG: hypothetical protein IEMM0003_0604 [bacterium]
MTVLILFLIVMIILGFPIAFAIGISTALVFLLHSMPIVMLAQRMFGGINSYMLLAVPLFMFAGALMDKGGLSKRIVDLAESVVGFLPGGLAIAGIMASMLFAGISGSAAADSAAIGSVIIPSMKKSGYKAPMAAATIASAGSMGVIIPPSIPMIIYGFITGISIGKLFVAGILPGVLIGISLSVVAFLLSSKSDARDNKEKIEFNIAKIKDSFKKAVLAIGAPVIVVGGILGGIFTATESGAIAVVYSFIVGKFFYKQLEWKKVYDAALSSAITSSVILLIISVATIFSWYLSINNVQLAISHFLNSMATGKIMVLLMINFFLLLMGTFVETTASLILFVPIVAPILASIGIDPLTSGVIVVTNLAIGMLTPPLGICLIVSGAIAKCSILQVSKAAIPFLIIMLVDLLMISFFGPLTTFLPSMMH